MCHQSYASIVEIIVFNLIAINDTAIDVTKFNFDYNSTSVFIQKLEGESAPANSWEIEVDMEHNLFPNLPLHYDPSLQTLDIV